MQYFEILFVIISSFYVTYQIFRPRRIPKNIGIVLLILLLLAHLFFDGFRWQMIPGYCIWIIALLCILRPAHPKSSALVKSFKTAGLILLTTIGIAIPMILPIFDLPQTTGTYHVGTKDISLALDREEIITMDPTDNRHIMIKAWYPSDSSQGITDPYVDPAGRKGFAQKYGMPSSMLNYLDLVNTRVYRDVPVATGPFPILIFSHGYNSKANGYYALLSEIASHGYIVLAINHTYESTGTTFSDGQEVFYDYAYAKKIEAGSWDLVAPAVEAFKKDIDFEGRHPTVSQALRTYYIKDINARWAQDIVDVVDALEEWNQEGFLNGRLDISRIGALGHSMGGGAAGTSLLKDDRIRAGANIDGVQWGTMVDTILQQPFLLLSSDWPEEHENLNQHAYINKSTATFYDAIILGSGHSNFMDIPLMIPMRGVSQAGSIDPQLAIAITTKLLVAFFDKHLKKENVNMATLSSSYKQLQLKIHKSTVQQ